MQVQLEAIKFNHDRTTATGDAFNIRRNETEVVDVTEWRRGVSFKPEDSPAAYARDTLGARTPTIRAKFSFRGFDSAIETLRIRALDGRLTPKLNYKESSKLLVELLKPVLREALSDNVLGSVMEREVLIKGGEEFELFNLDDVKISSAGVSVSDIIWRWQFRTNATDWTDFATTTHRIFTVLALPKKPWDVEVFEDTNTQLPWAEVLDYACRWAAGAADLDEAATLVTQTVNGLGPTLLKYDNPSGGPTGFAINSPYCFDCTDFLKRLRDQKNKQGRGVNCDDCAAIVVTFANILGCDLNEGDMNPPSFALKRHLQIGLDGVFKGSFSHHTVGWKGSCGEDDEVFDACIQLDFNLNLDGNVNLKPQWFVPTKMRFGQLTDREYRFRLAKNPQECHANKRPLRRRIGIPKLQIDIDSIEDFLGKTKANPFLSQHILGKAKLSTLHLTDHRFVETDDSSFLNQSFWTEVMSSDTAIGVDAYEYDSIESADLALKKIVASFQLTTIVQQEGANFGSEVFAVPEYFAIAFRRNRFVFRLRNTGTKLNPCDEFARVLDNLVKNIPV